MSKPANILNPKPDADNRLDGRVKFYAISVTGFTLFYLFTELKLDAKSLHLPFGIGIEGLDTTELLGTLFVLNIIVWLRLGWRIFISYEYNEYHKRAAVKVCDKRNTAGQTLDEQQQKSIEKAITEVYEIDCKPLRRLDKYAVGFGLPAFAGGCAIAGLFYKICPNCNMYYIVIGIAFIVLAIFVIFKVLLKLFRCLFA